MKGKQDCVELYSQCLLELKALFRECSTTSIAEFNTEDPSSRFTQSEGSFGENIYHRLYYWLNLTSNCRLLEIVSNPFEGSRLGLHM